MRYIIVPITIFAFVFFAFYIVYGMSESMKTEDITQNTGKGVWQLEKIVYPSGKVIKPPEVKTYVCITDEHIFISSLIPLSEGAEPSINWSVSTAKGDGTKITMISEMRVQRWANSALTIGTDAQTYTTDVKLDGKKVELKVPATPSTAVFDGDTLTVSWEEGTAIYKRVERFN